MPIRIRKSINFGPIRLNASRKGLGASIGVKGLRTSIRADGSRYIETSIPGTGISSRTEHGKMLHPTNPDVAPPKASGQNSGKEGIPVFAMIMIAVIATAILVELAL